MRLIVIGLLAVAASSAVHSVGNTSSVAYACAPSGSGTGTGTWKLLEQGTISVPTRNVHAGNSPLVDTSYYLTQLFGQHNVCGQVTEIQGQCKATVAPAAETDMNCRLTQNGTSQWTTGFQQFFGTTAQQTSQWFLAGPTGTKWVVCMAAQTAFPDGGTSETKNWPNWGDCTTFIVN
jgi:hypothetical protein